MSTKQFDAWINQDADPSAALVKGLASSSAVKPYFTKNDTINLVLHGLKVNTDPAALPSEPFVASSIDYATLRAGILLIDAAPKGGTWGAQAGANTTAALDSQITKPDLQTALNNLASVAAAGGLTVINSGAGNIYGLQWNVPANAIPISLVNNELTPFCLLRYYEDEDVPGKREIKLAQAPIVYTTAFANPAAPPVTVAEVRAGAPLTNEIQRITVPADAVGQFSLTFSGAASLLLAVLTVTAQQIQDALNSPYLKVNATDVRFSVTVPNLPPSATAGGQFFDVEFIGAFAAAAQAGIVPTMYDQSPLDTPTASFSLKRQSVEDALDGAASAQLIFEIVAVDGGGKETTLVNCPCMLYNRGLDNGDATLIAQLSTTTQTIVVPAAATDPTVIARLGTARELGAPTIAGATAIIEHDFNTFDVDLTILLKLTDAPETWRALTNGLEYSWEATDANHVTVYLGLATTATPAVGSIKIWITTLNAEPIINATLRLPTDSVDGSGAFVGSTLTTILTSLQNSLPAGWPNIPANKIAGALTASQIDLSSLLTAMQASSQFATAIQSVVTQAGIINAIAGALQNSTLFATTLANIFAAGNATLNAAVSTALQADPAFASSVQADILGFFQAGAQMPNGALLIEIADVAETYPTPRSAAAGAIQEYATLLACVHGSVDKGPFTGTLPIPSVANAGWRYTVAGSALASSAGNRRGRTYGDGKILVSDGAHWFAASLNGADAYAAEMDRVLFTVNVTAGMLALATQFLAAFTIQLKLAGCPGQSGEYLFRLKTGVPDATGSNPAWDAPIFTQRIVLTEDNTYHTFGYQVTRSAGNVIIAQKTIYSATSAASNPSAPAEFLVRAELVQFDTAAKSGAVIRVMKGAKASIVPLTP